MNDKKKEKDLVAALRNVNDLWPSKGFYLVVAGEDRVLLMRHTGQDPKRGDIVAEFDKIQGTSMCWEPE